MNKQQVLVVSLIIGVASIFAAGSLALYHNQQQVAVAVARVQELEKKLTLEDDNQGNVRVVERVVSAQPWGKIQGQVTNTVAQIVCYRAEPDLLEPHKPYQQGRCSGSGFFINDTGELITNSHVVQDARAVWIRIPAMGKVMVDVEVVGHSPERDLALLRVTPTGLQMIKEKLGKVPYLQFGDSDQVRRADEILTLGYPLGQLSLKSTNGVVSGREQNLIQVSSAINPGSSGGPSLTSDGKVVGVTCSGILSAQNVGYIIPINDLKPILDDLRKNKLLKKPILGVLLNNTNQEMATYFGNPTTGGVYVVDVYNGSVLAKAGVQVGDVLYEINGHQIDMYGDLTLPWSEDKVSVSDYASRLEVGEEITVVFYRKGERREINFTFDFSDVAPVRRLFVGDEAIEYEIFGGMLVQPLMLNHIPALVNNAPNLAKYTEFKHQMKPAVVVTHLIPNSQVQRLSVIVPGVVIDEVNGKPVGTMQEYRAALKEGVQGSFMTFKTVEGLFFVIDPKTALQEMVRSSIDYQYPISPFIKELMKSVGIAYE